MVADAVVVVAAHFVLLRNAHIRRRETKRTETSSKTNEINEVKYWISALAHTTSGNVDYI